MHGEGAVLDPEVSRVYHEQRIVLQTVTQQSTFSVLGSDSFSELSQTQCNSFSVF